MKDYDRIVIWLDYFNSGFSRAEGRRVPINMAVRNPSITELEEAVKRSGYVYESYKAFHPKRMFIRSNYISIKLKKPKTKIIREIASSLSMIRGEQRHEAKEKKS